MNPYPEKSRLGEYQLLELKKETACDRLWLAEQTSIHRRAVVLERREDSPRSQADFLADIRAKASVEHPLVGSVYEAVEDGTRSFAALEFLPGTHLARRAAEGRKPEPLQLAQLLKRVSEAFLSFEAAGLDSAPLRLADLFLDGYGVIRLKNIAIAGSRNADRSVCDVSLLGKELPALIAEGRPGASRLALLCSWMRGDGLDAPLSWEQTRDYCAQIEQQLSEAHHLPQPGRSRAIPAWIWIAAGIVILGIPAAFVFSGGLDRPSKKKKTTRIQLPAPVSLPGETYSRPDGGSRTLAPFRMAAHETTIGEYQEFLTALETLSASGKEKSYDDPNQPAAKDSHIPDDWYALLTAAKNGESWNNFPVSLSSPVIGVDWWDASAFARWKGGDLPEQDEWQAALRKGAAFPEKIPVSRWEPFDEKTTDRSPLGLLHMAGSVSEWTKSPAPDPSNPLGTPKWVLVGGSHAKPGSNALTREWVDDPGLRRPDIGFRVIYREEEK